MDGFPTPTSTWQQYGVDHAAGNLAARLLSRILCTHLATDEDPAECQSLLGIPDCSLANDHLPIAFLVPSLSMRKQPHDHLSPQDDATPA